MHVHDFDFELPPELIARRSVEPRDRARLFVHERATRQNQHRVVADLPELLREGDLLVLNDTRVMPWRLCGRRATGGAVECLLLRLDAADGATAHGEAFVKPSKKLRAGDRLPMEEDALLLTLEQALGGGRWRVALDAVGGDVAATLERCGRAPLPPYIGHEPGQVEDVAADRRRYQTVFAKAPGAVAAPTAGLHFTEALLGRLAAAGVAMAFVTLHVGEGTFAPLRTDVVEQHRMHEERYELPAATAAAVAATRARGGRVVAVGTTSCRTLETCAAEGRTVRAGSGASDLFLYPGRSFQVVDALLTNFHLPQSTLLMLVSAFAGHAETMALYREAVAQRYRFFSFGDAMLLL
ncbi:MAG: tRNA preQ1(34) S-adenosylmethionine ribosyltransferase-isomerase QueA [Planctomycetes bacterium]|nr:tRNA preQ1(34) S-adenosylmethionine ribosyltransferase-isomerase QueA [Planctomycetota bacterium]